MFKVTAHFPTSPRTGLTPEDYVVGDYDTYSKAYTWAQGYAKAQLVQVSGYVEVPFSSDTGLDSFVARANSYSATESDPILATVVIECGNLDGWHAAIIAGYKWDWRYEDPKPAEEAPAAPETPEPVAPAPEPKYWDDKNSVRCGRCGGSGHMPFSAYNGVCFRCNGRGIEPITPKGQAALIRKLEKQGVRKVAELREAQVGDLIVLSKTASIITAITWRKPSNSFQGNVDNQVVHLARIIDGAKGRTSRAVTYLPTGDEVHAWTISRDDDGNEVRTPCRTDVPVSDAMVGQEATQDEAGEWVRF